MSSIDIRTVDLVIYHNPCVDGTAGAWPFWRENRDRYAKGLIKFQGYRNDHSDPPDVKGLNVVIVDCCYSREKLLKMKNDANRVIVLDHHDTNERCTEGLDDCIFDMDRSGAQIAWDFVYPQTQRPWFIDIIADRDLWKWEIPHSKSIGKAMFAQECYTWEKMDDLMRSIAHGTSKTDIATFRIIGDILNSVEEQEIKSSCRKAVLSNFRVGDDVYRVKVSYCPPHLRSDVGNKLADHECDFAAIYTYDFSSDQWWISLRGHKGGLNLAKIAERLGGGGHPPAAGFVIDGSKGENLKTYFTPI